MKKWILPTKSIDKENIQYEWIAEGTACKVCKKLDSTIYDSANDIPDRPHPNCKCHIEIIEKDSDEPVTDPFEAHKKEREEELRIKLEVQKLLGDTKSLTEEIDEYLRQVETEEQKFKDFQQVVDIEELETEDKQKLSQAIEKIQFAKFRGESVKKDLTNIQTEAVILKGKIEKIKILNIPLIVLNKALEVLFATFQALFLLVKELINLEWKGFLKSHVLQNIAIKILADGYGDYHTRKYNMPEALNLYKVASVNKKFNKDYVAKNGQMYDSIDDLHDYTLEKDIHSRIQKEMRLKDCKVLKLRPDSSVAKEIENSNLLQKFIETNGKKMLDGETIVNSPIEFKSDDSDLYSAIHGGVFKNAYIDKTTKIMHISAEDFYNFELRFTSGKAVLGRYLQDSDMLVPFYLIVELRIPESIWRPLIK